MNFRAIRVRLTLGYLLILAVVLSGDPEALRRVVFALLENAIKYSPAGSTVSLEIAHDGAQAICRVTDSGIGIAPFDLERIFHRFWRADQVRSPGQGGAGLGLSIAQWIVHRHQGTIQVSSEPGKGSQFEVRIPIVLRSNP